ncbi:MAG: hypothetical protein IJ801_02440 [Lachnospiraceae bacterium]|nr:hypothetical protein [Lachnospiraceae bacterium]
MEQGQPKKEKRNPEEQRAKDRNTEDEELRKQYHPAFCEAMTEELERNLDQIECMREYNLNSLPNRIDLLVVKKNADTELESGLGKIFRRHNLVEYRSPGQALDTEVYYRSMGYAYLYTAYQAEVSSVEEVTLSFVREGKPVRLMEQFEDWGFEIMEYESGIYHVKKRDHMDMQIIVTRELDQKYVWLRSLTGQLTLEDARYLAHRAGEVKDEPGRIRVRTILDLVSRLNQDKKWMKEMNGMGAFRDLFKEEFEEKDQKIAELSEQLKSKDEQLLRLQQELEQLKKQMGKIAMF